MTQTKGCNKMNNFIGLLTVLFIGLKLTGYINWSWWLVTLPLWGGFTVLAVIATIALLIAVAAK